MRALRRVLPYFRPYRTQAVFGLITIVLSSAFASVVPWVLSDAVDLVQKHAPLPQIWRAAGIMVGLAVISGVFRFGMRELFNSVSRYIEYDLRNDLFTHLETLDASFATTMRTGDVMARLTNDLAAVRMAAGPAIMYLVNTIAGGAFAVAFMLRIDVRLTILSLLPMAFLPIAMARLGAMIHQRFESVQEQFATLTVHAQEHLAGVRVVRAYRQEGPEVARFAEMNDEYLTRNMRLVRLWGLTNPLFAVLAGLGAIVVLGVGGSLAIQGTLSVGAFVGFGFYLSMLTWPLISLGWVTNLFQRGEASMARLTEILDAVPRVRDDSSLRSLPSSERGRSIEFRDVGFSYPTSTASDEPVRWAIRHISFTIPAGATLGVAGATGSGKTALIELLPRIYDPQEGEILLDGVPIRDIAVEELRREIGFVPQESFVFSDTIAANLGYGAPDAEAGRWAAGVAHLEETIETFPDHYDTILGERGINLSGGQRQRVALARALARRPNIVILDDALSAVDTETEAAILRGLRGALAGRTAVIASHRASALRDAGWIVVLDAGGVIEQGRHDTLVALRGRYWSLVRQQELLDAIERTDAAPAETAG